MTSRFGFGNNTDMHSNGNPLGRVTDNASLPQYNVSKFIGFEGPFLTFWRGSYYLSAASFGNATLHGGPGPQSAYGRDGNYNAYAGKADSIHGNFTTAMQPPWLMVPMGGHNTLFRDKTGALWSTIWYGEIASVCPIVYFTYSLCMCLGNKLSIYASLLNPSTGPHRHHARSQRITNGLPRQVTAMKDHISDIAAAAARTGPCTMGVLLSLTYYHYGTTAWARPTRSPGAGTGVVQAPPQVLQPSPFRGDRRRVW